MWTRSMPAKQLSITEPLFFPYCETRLCVVLRLSTDRANLCNLICFMWMKEKKQKTNLSLCACPKEKVKLNIYSECLRQYSFHFLNYFFSCCCCCCWIILWEALLWKPSEYLQRLVDALSQFSSGPTLRLTLTSLCNSSFIIWRKINQIWLMNWMCIPWCAAENE